MYDGPDRITVLPVLGCKADDNGLKPLTNEINSLPYGMY